MFGTVIVGMVLGRSAASNASDWAEFKARFLQPDGRIVDTANGGISHSEGQGWGMLAAVAAGDRENFERIWTWTAQTLKRPADALFSWRFRPGVPTPVDDPNNATDGDLYIAWALANAALRWGQPSYREASARIARAILSLCTVPVGQSLILLPGVQGFSTATHVIINPSYFVFPAFRALATIAPDPRWARLERDSLDLLDRGRFGTWRLPPDWLSLQRATGRLQPADRWPARFGFDAVRIPLLLAWGRHHQAPAFAAARRFWSTARPGGAPPAWVDLRTAEVAPYPASHGVLSIARLADAVALGQRFSPASNQLIMGDYYASMLSLLSKIAAEELSLAVP